jgi:ABC-type multidrug transport system permease subunit
MTGSPVISNRRAQNAWLGLLTLTLRQPCTMQVFRPAAGLLDWFAVIGMIALAAFAITWISVALGLQARNPESASNIVLPVALLPILGGVFVRPESMPSGIRWFAQY